MPLTAAAPEALIETARIFFFTSAARPLPIGLPPSMSLQNTISPVLCPLTRRRPMISGACSFVRACPRSPLSGTTRVPRCFSRSAVPPGTFSAKHSTVIVPWRARKSLFIFSISASLDAR